MTWRTLGMLGGLLVAFVTVEARAQEAPDGWAFGAGGFAVKWRDQDYSPIEWLAGPALQASYLKARGLGFDARVGYFVDTGFYGANGLSGIVGLTYGVPAGRHLFQVKAGGTGFFGGNSDGSQLAGGGPYGGAGMTFRVAGRFGVQLEALGRGYRTGSGWTVAPSGAVSLMLLPR
jgi:hypothetical protein